MAKELPFFKFFVSEWNDGKIVDCTMEAQGLFINLCSLYWSRLGELDNATAMRKLCQRNATAYKELKTSKIIKVLGNKISIEFLDEQLGERKHVSEEARKTALKRWNKDANAMPTHSQRNANAMHRREDKKREENTKKADFVFASQIASLLNKPYPKERWMNGAGKDIDMILAQLSEWPQDMLINQVKAMKAYFIHAKWNFPTNPATIITNIQETDWVEKLKETDPEHQAKAKTATIKKEYDEIGTSAPGSLG